MNSRQNPYAAVLHEIENGLWEHDVRVDNGIAAPYSYDDATFRACLKIFMSAMLWRLWTHSAERTMPDKERLAETVGSLIRRIVLRFTGIDAHTLYNDIKQAKDGN